MSSSSVRVVVFCAFFFCAACCCVAAFVPMGEESPAEKRVAEDVEDGADAKRSFFSFVSDAVSDAVPVLDPLGVVVDEDGPVSGAAVRLVRLDQEELPCAGHGCFDEEHQPYWFDRLDDCRMPSAVAITKSKRGGLVDAAPEVAASANGIEVTHGNRAGWYALTETRGDVSFELQRAVTLTVPVYASKPYEEYVVVVDDEEAKPEFVDGRAALFFSDGRCVPLTQKTPGIFESPAPVPTRAQGLLVVEVGGKLVGDVWYGDESVSFNFDLFGDEGEGVDEDVPMCSGRETTVKVVDQRGDPVVGALVWNRNDKSLTDSRGRAVFQAWDADTAIDVELPSAPASSCNTAYAPLFPCSTRESDTLVVTMQLVDVDKRPIKGTVRDEQGRPVAGAQLVFGEVTVEADDEDGIDCFVPTAPVHSASDGSFSVEVPRGHAVQLIVGHPWYPRLERDVAAEEDVVDVVMSAGARVRGRISIPDGFSFRGCQAVWEGGGASPCPEGFFDLRALEPGMGAITVFVSDDKGNLRQQNLALTLASGDDLVEDVRFPSGMTRGGRVVDQDGNPVPYAPVQAYTSDGSSGLFTTTDERGAFSFKHLSDSPWSFHCYGESVEAEGADVEIVVDTSPWTAPAIGMHLEFD